MRRRSQLTLWSVDSPAKTSASQGEAQVWIVEADPGSGQRWLGSSESADPLGFLLRTCLLSELGGQTESLGIWTRSVTPAGRSWWVLTMPARHTSGAGSGSWPTATATDAKAGGSRAGTPRSSSTARAHPGTSLTDTPTQRDYKDSAGMSFARRKDGASRVDLLPRQVFLLERIGDYWPTPTASTYGSSANGVLRHGGMTPSGHWEKPRPCAGKPSLERLARSLSGGLLDPASASANGKRRGSGRGVLNSRWVNQLMGFPSGWLAVGIERASALWATASSRRSSRR